MIGEAMMVKGGCEKLVMVACNMPVFRSLFSIEIAGSSYKH
jgi:hypothetical protein